MNLQEIREIVRAELRYRAIPTRYVTHVAKYMPDDENVEGLVMFVIKYNTEKPHFYMYKVIPDEVLEHLTTSDRIEGFVRVTARDAITTIELKEKECTLLDGSMT
jgi:hypothetical protein